MADLCFKDGQTVVCIGDSITDCGRRGGAAPFGSGYVSMLVELLTANWPERNIRFINKGIGGNTCLDMLNRWEDDLIRHQPDWVTILIGINDLHQTLGKTNDHNPALFRANYTKILDTLKEKTKAQLVLLDPFYMSADHSGQSWRTKVLDFIPEYLGVVDEMVAKYGARHVKLHEAFQRQLKYRDSDTFCGEPVHPNHTGHLLIATELLKVLMGW